MNLYIFEIEYGNWTAEQYTRYVFAFDVESAFRTLLDKDDKKKMYISNVELKQTIKEQNFIKQEVK